VLFSWWMSHHRLHLAEQFVIDDLEHWEKNDLQHWKSLSAWGHSCFPDYDWEADKHEREMETQLPEWFTPLIRRYDVSSFTHMVHLRLPARHIDDGYVRRIARLSELRTLEILGTPVSSAHLVMLERSLPTCHISVQSPNHLIRFELDPSDVELDTDAL